MNQGVEILLSRMDSNPDEFADMFKSSHETTHEWEWILLAVIKHVTKENVTALAFLTDTEIRALYAKYTQLQGGNFTKRVMKQLLDDAGADKKMEFLWRGLAQVKEEGAAAVYDRGFSAKVRE